jgi:hypothetical protein
MGTRLYNVVVVGFWLATMSWLLVDKLWPTLRVGDPPNYHSILKALEGEEANHWAIYWNDRPTGWSVGQVVNQPGGIRELHSRVFIADLPLDELVPHWLAAAIRPVLNQAGRWDMEMRSRLDVDRVGQIAGFDSTLQIAGGSAPVRVYGTVEGDQFKLHSAAGDLPSSFSLARNALVGDGISPQGYLPDLYLDQAWTIFAYNPFQAAGEPLEIIQARVEQHETIPWNGKPVRAWLVVYRGESGDGLMSDPRAKVWVREDGLVLEQELMLFGSRLRFNRLSPEDSREFSQALEPYADREIPADTSRRLMGLIDSTDNREPWTD